MEIDGYTFNDDEQAIFLLLLTPRFHHQVDALRIKYGIPATGLNNKQQEAFKESLGKARQEELVHDIYEIINSFDQLSEGWYQGLRWYILDDNAYNLRNQAPYELKFDYEGETTDKAKNIQSVWIKVDARTDQRKVLAGFKEAKRMLATKGKWQPITYINHALFAREKRNAGAKQLTWQKVADAVNDEFNLTSNGLYDGTRISELVKTLESRIT